MLEVLHSTGMRRMEIIELQQRGVDDERGTLMIRQGKGKKDRMVPIGERALAWLAKYRDEVCDPNWRRPATMTRCSCRYRARRSRTTG